MNSLLDFDRKENKVYYIGYDMKLTRAEYEILAYLDENDEASVEELASRLSWNREIGLGNVAVHVCNINKKAKIIGGRNIIESDYGKGYKIGEFI